MVRGVENPIATLRSRPPAGRGHVLESRSTIRPRVVYTLAEFRTRSAASRALPPERPLRRQVSPESRARPNRVDPVRIDEGPVTAWAVSPSSATRRSATPPARASQTTERAFPPFHDRRTYDPDRLTLDQELLRFSTRPAATRFQLVSAVAELTPDGTTSSSPSRERARSTGSAKSPSSRLARPPARPLEACPGPGPGETYNADQVEGHPSLTDEVGGSATPSSRSSPGPRRTSMPSLSTHLRGPRGQRSYF